MKKTISILLILLLAISLATLTGCGEDVYEHPYKDYDLTQFVTLPDYDTYEMSKVNVTVTEEDMLAEMQAMCEEYGIDEITDEWVKANTSFTSVKRFKKALREHLEEEYYNDALTKVEEGMFQYILDNSKANPAQEMVDRELNILDTFYTNYATYMGMTWEEYLEGIEMTQTEYDDQLVEYAEELVKNDIIAYAFANKEKVKIEQSQMDTVVAYIVQNSQTGTAGNFKEKMGIEVEEYSQILGFTRSLFAEAALNKVYDRNAK